MLDHFDYTAAGLTMSIKLREYKSNGNYSCGTVTQSWGSSFPLQLVAQGAGGFVDKGRFLWVIIRVCVGDIYCIDWQLQYRNRMGDEYS